LVIVREIFGLIETITCKEESATTRSELQIYSIANTTDSKTLNSTRCELIASCSSPN
jgi:hypothetical protein